MPAPDAGANAPALIVGNFDVAYDYVRQYSSRCALIARALFGRNLMFLSKSVTDLMSVYDDVRRALSGKNSTFFPESVGDPEPGFPLRAFAHS